MLTLMPMMPTATSTLVPSETSMSLVSEKRFCLILSVWRPGVVLTR